MNKIIKYTLALGFIGFLTQSCEKQADATYWEDYYTPPVPPTPEEFTPDWSDSFSNFDKWETLVNDGEGEIKLGNDPDATWTQSDNGLNVVALGGWHHRITATQVKDDFVAEIKIRINSSNADFPKAGLFVGNIGGDVPRMWLGLDNWGGTNSVYRFVPDGPEWANFGPEDFDVHQWQVLKITKVGSKLSVFINGILSHELEDDAVLKIEGNIGLSVEGADVDVAYFRVNNFYDDFMNLDAWGPKPSPASTWSTETKGLKVFARSGWHHRAVTDMVAENFIAEFKLKLHDALGTYPKAGIMIGGLGGDVPRLIYGLDNYDGSSTVVKFIQGRPDGEWHNLDVDGLNVNEWQVLRVKKEGNTLVFYKDGLEYYREQGDHILGIQGQLGIIVEGCEADYDYISYKAI